MREVCQEPLFPQSLLEPLLTPMKKYPFRTKARQLDDFMAEFFKTLELTKYSMEKFLECSSLPILFSATRAELDPVMFHSRVDGKCPIAVIIFFEHNLLVGTTFCSPLSSATPKTVDLSSGYFSYCDQELNAFISIDHTIYYKEEGLQIGDGPTLYLNFRELERSQCNIEFGKEQVLSIAEILPNWPAAIEGIVVVQLVP